MIAEKNIEALKKVRELFWSSNKAEETGGQEKRAIRSTASANTEQFQALTVDKRFARWPEFLQWALGTVNF